MEHTEVILVGGLALILALLQGYKATYDSTHRTRLESLEEEYELKETNLILTKERDEARQIARYYKKEYEKQVEINKELSDKLTVALPPHITEVDSH